MIDIRQSGAEHVNRESNSRLAKICYCSLGGLYWSALVERCGGRISHFVNDGT